VESASAASRLRLALDRYEVGEGLARLQLRGEYLDAGSAEIGSALCAWRLHRPTTAAPAPPPTVPAPAVLDSVGRWWRPQRV